MTGGARAFEFFKPFIDVHMSRIRQIGPNDR